MSDYSRPGVGNGRRRAAGGRWEALLRVQISQAQVAGDHILLGVGFEGGPPEAMADELRRPVGPRVAGEATGVTPLEDLAPDRRGDKQAVRRTPSRVRLGALGHPHCRFGPPRDNTYHPGRRKDGVHRRTVAGGVRREHSGKGVRPHVLGARAVGQGEIELAEK